MNMETWHGKTEIRGDKTSHSALGLNPNIWDYMQATNLLSRRRALKTKIRSHFRKFIPYRAVNTSCLESNVYWTVHHCNSWRMKYQLDIICYFISLIMLTNEIPTWCHLLFYFTYYADEWNTNLMSLAILFHLLCRKLLKIDILMSETCWAHNKWNKIASDIKLVFHSSTSSLGYKNQSVNTVQK